MLTALILSVEAFIEGSKKRMPEEMGRELKLARKVLYDGNETDMKAPWPC